MPELFGAPNGIIAKQDYQNQGLQAQRLMGDIAMQPAELQTKQAQARLYAAEAGAKEATNAQAQRMADLESQFMQSEADARKQVSDSGVAQGTVMTVKDLPSGGSIMRASAADSLERLLQFSNGRLPPSATAGLSKQVADIHQKEAAAAANNSKASLEATKGQIAQFEQIGNVAGSAALSPANYAAILMDPQTRKLLPQELTGNYRTDVPVLRAIEQASQDSIKRANLAREQADSESKRRLNNAQISKADAAIDLIKTRATALKEDRTLRAKYGGATSQEAADLKKAQTALTQARMEALALKTAPPMPLDPALVEVGKTYTGAGGVKYDIIGLDAKGNPIGRPHVQAAYTAPSAPATDEDLTGEGDDDADE
jgi:hypothetical protein